MFAKSAVLDIRLLRVSRLPLLWRLRFLLQKYRVLPWLLLHRATRFDVPPLRMSLRDAIGLGTLQSSLVDFYADVVRPRILGCESPVIVDVGANVGQFANAAKLFYPDAEVVCFEPDPRTFADLVANTAGLTNVTVRNLGLDETNGRRPFYRHKLSVMSTFSPNEDAELARTPIMLPMTTLDDAMSSYAAVDLVKVDVEGHESSVLSGGWETVRRSGFLLLELSLSRNSGSGNLKLLQDIFEHVPGAAIIRFGRPLGQPERPQCQDVLLRTRSAS